MEAYEYRDGDIVEVTPDRRDGHLPPSFRGVVDSRRALQKRIGISQLSWVHVRQLEPAIRNWSGGWYARQCRLIIRPPQIPALPVPDNVELGSD